MKFKSIGTFVVLLAWINSTVAAQDRRSVGIPPFDLASVEAGVEARTSLATLVRVEMLKNPELNPQSLTLPRGTFPPLPDKQAIALGREAEVQFVVLGTILEATVTRSSNRVAKGGGLGRVIGAVSSSVTRVTAKIALHAELLNTVTGTTEAFEVSATNTDVGVGADLSTTLGGFGAGDEGWQKTPMGKALREAAQKLVEEVARRTAKPAAP